MKMYILLLVLIISNIGYTQTTIPKQDLYDSLMQGTKMRSQLDFFMFLRPVAFVPLSPDTLIDVNVSAFWVLYNDIRTDYPYDYYTLLQIPSKSDRKNKNRYIEYVGFIWKIDSIWVYIVEVRLHATDIFKGVTAGRYRRSIFESLIEKSIIYNKPSRHKIGR